MSEVPAGPDGSASRAVLGRGSVYTVATAGPALVTVAVLPVLTRILPVGDFDLVSVATAVVQVLMIAVGLGMGAAITRQYFLHAAGRQGARGLVLSSALASSCVAAVLAATAPAWSPSVLGRPSSAAVLLAVVAGLGGAWMTSAQAYLRGEDRAGAFVALAIVASLVGPVAGLTLAVFVRPTATAYLAGVAGGFAVAGLLGVHVALRAGRTPLDWRHLGAALRIGVPTMPHQVSIYIALSGLVVVADRVLTEGGRANVALTIGGATVALTAALNNAWAPAVYRTPEGQRARILDETAASIGFVAVVLAGGVALLAPWVLAVVADRSLDPHGMVLAAAVASAAALPSVLYLASAHLVFASGRTGWLAVTTPAAVAVGIVVAALLARTAGLVAVGIGYVTAYALLALNTALLQRRVSTERWRPRMPVRVVALWVAATVLGAWLPTAGTPSLLRVAAAALLAVTGLVWLRRLRAPRRPGADPDGA